MNTTLQPEHEWIKKLTLKKLLFIENIDRCLCGTSIGHKWQLNLCKKEGGERGKLKGNKKTW